MEYANKDNDDDGEDEKETKDVRNAHDHYDKSSGPVMVAKTFDSTLKDRC